MRELTVSQNEIRYAALFARPAFNLWGEGKTILASLYDAFRDYGVTLRDITASGDASTPAAHEVSVKLGARASFSFRLDRIEAVLSNFTDSDLKDFPLLLSRGAECVRAVVPEHGFESHFFSYASHSMVSDGDAANVLKKLSKPPETNTGEWKGSGLIYHFDLQPQNWRVQVILDHSVALEGGLWVQAQFLVFKDQLEYTEVAEEARSMLGRVLASAGLQFAPTAQNAF